MCCGQPKNKSSGGVITMVQQYDLQNPVMLKFMNGGAQVSYTGEKTNYRYDVGGGIEEILVDSRDVASFLTYNRKGKSVFTVSPNQPQIEDQEEVEEINEETPENNIQTFSDDEIDALNASLDNIELEEVIPFNFASIDGINSKAVAALKENNVTSLAQAFEMGVENLTAIKGVSLAQAELIYNYAKETNA